MTMWRIDRKVGNYKNDLPDILDPVEEIREDLFDLQSKGDTRM